MRLSSDLPPIPARGHDAAFAAAQATLAPAMRAWPRPRDLTPALRAAARMGLDPVAPGYPSIAVVGSKGKGSTTLAASAALAGLGLRVGTVTSPALVSQRERIRVDGAPISTADYVRAARRVHGPVREVLEQDPDAVIPHLGGMHFLAALSHFEQAGVDAAVFEASMGGRQDEVALLRAPVLVVTALLAEHLGVLGDDVAQIAAEKLGALSSRTQVVVTLEQPDPCARAVLERACAGVRLVTVERAPRRTGHRLTDLNLELGRVAARELARVAGLPEQPVELPHSLRLPGRCELLSATLMVDTAIAPDAVGEAVSAYRARVGCTPRVLACFPRSKDAPGCLRVLSELGVDVVGVRLPAGAAEHLQPDPAQHGRVEVVELSQLDLTAEPTLAVGTVSFVTAVMTQMGAGPVPAW